MRHAILSAELVTVSCRMGGLVVGGGQGSLYYTHLGTDRIFCEEFRWEINLEVGFQVW